MSFLQPKFIPSDKSSTGWSERVPWTDDECILLCLENSVNLCGLDKKQVERLLKDYERKVTESSKGEILS